MHCPQFSQIPSVVLKKLNHDDFTKRKQKKVKFYDDLPGVETSEGPEEVTSSFDDHQIIEKHNAKTPSPTPKTEKKTIKPYTSSHKIIPTGSILNDTHPVLRSAIKSTQGEPVFKYNPDEYTPENVFTIELTKDNKPKFVNVEVQTDDTPYGRCDQCQARMDAFCKYKPMYSIPKRDGNLPPLKIGLTLPKGRKRKVYYPDDEQESAEAC